MKTKTLLIGAAVAGVLLYFLSKRKAAAQAAVKPNAMPADAMTSVWQELGNRVNAAVQRTVPGMMGGGRTGTLSPNGFSGEGQVTADLTPLLTGLWSLAGKGISTVAKGIGSAGSSAYDFAKNAVTRNKPAAPAAVDDSTWEWMFDDMEPAATFEWGPVQHIMAIEETQHSTDPSNWIDWNPEPQSFDNYAWA